jgi:arylsulfatase
MRGMRAIPRYTAAIALLWLAPGCERAPPGLVLLLTVDTLRADHLGVYGAPPGRTPHLDRLGGESTVFESAYTPASHTLAAMSAAMTSRYPEEVGVQSNLTSLEPGAVTLAAWLSERGWRTAAVVSNYVLRRASGIDSGFERFDDHMRSREKVRRVPERAAQQTTAAALAALDDVRGEKPVFLWVHYQDPHGPYAPPESRRAAFLEEEARASDGQRLLPVRKGDSGQGAIPAYQILEGRQDVAFYRAGYKGEVSYVDAQIGRLRAGLVERGLWAHATILLAADHGEALGEGEYWFAHGERVTEELVRVPLMLRVPGRPAQRRRDRVSLLDVFPTLATLAGSPAPSARGRDLLAPRPSAPEPFYTSTLRAAPARHDGLVAGDWKYVRTRERTGESERLFRLGDDDQDVAARQPDVVASMRAALDALQRSAGATASASPRRELTPEEREAFKALGYIED